VDISELRRGKGESVRNLLEFFLDNIIRLCGVLSWMDFLVEFLAVEFCFVYFIYALLVYMECLCRSCCSLKC